MFDIARRKIRGIRNKGQKGNRNRGSEVVDVKCEYVCVYEREV